MHDTSEITLRRPLRPVEIASVVGSLNFQLEFFSGREFGLRLRGADLVLLNRAREVLETLNRAAAAPPGAAPPQPPQPKLKPVRR
jgi:hypothetical protein